MPLAMKEHNQLATTWPDRKVSLCPQHVYYIRVGTKVLQCGVAAPLLYLK